MIRYFYTFFLTLVSPILLFGLYKKKPGKPTFGSRWKEHFGHTPPLHDQTASPIWIHTVSVGETIAATPFIRALHQQYPKTPIIITTTTSTGAQQAKKLADIAEHRYMPLDFPFAIKGFLGSIRPKVMLIMETELWPNTLHHAAKTGIPITVINARLSERSAKKYKKFQRIFDLLAKNLSLILCQHQDDADRFIQLGVVKDNVKVTGSLKFDIQVPDEIHQSGTLLRETLGEKRPIWIAASTHEGEDKQVLNAHRAVLKQHPNALLIIVPRHPERFNDVYQLCISKDFCTQRRTDKNNQSQQTQVYLADTMGEMMLLLRASDVCFMGGSLLGDKVGGHNLLEPAALGIPTLIGPSFYNFHDIANQLIACGATSIIENSDQLSQHIIQIFSDPQKAVIQSKIAMAFVQKNTGATVKSLSEIQKLIV